MFYNMKTYLNSLRFPLQNQNNVDVIMPLRIFDYLLKNIDPICVLITDSKELLTNKTQKQTTKFVLVCLF